MKVATEQDPLVDVPRMAAQLSISQRGLRRLVAAGTIPYYRVGGPLGALRFNPDEVLAALRSEALSA